MNGPMILTFAILGVTIILFIADLIRIDIVALLALLALVLTPGGYRFGDFMKSGLPLLIIFLLVSLALVPLIWSL